MDSSMLKQQLVAQIMEIQDAEFLKALQIMIQAKNVAKKDIKDMPQSAEDAFLKEPEEEVIERAIESWLKDV